MSISFDSALGIFPRALELRAQRHELLVGNLAHADTPGYKARDIDFQSALSQAREGRVTLAATDPAHRTGAGVGAETEVRYRVPQQPSLDGNTVDPQVEQAALAENATRYQATLQFLGGRFKGMINAIQAK